MKTLHFKEGQTYVCTKANESWWTEGKKYKVGLSVFNEPFLADDDGDHWSSNDLSVYDITFKLEKEQPKIMFKLLVTKYNAGEGIEVTEFNYIDKYYFEDDYLILYDNTNKVKTYIQKDQVLEFEVHYE